MTDALFNLEYLAANVGSDIEIGGDVFYNEELTSDANGKITLTAIAVPAGTGGLTKAFVRLSSATSDARTSVEVATDNTITVDEANTAYCVRYMHTNASARKIAINSNFIPDTLTVILTAALYAGDANAPTTGTKVGSLTIKIPRFLLSGNQELAMTSTGASTTNFEGSALASGGGGCDGGSIYCEIVEAIFDTRWFDSAIGLVIEDSNISMTATDAQANLDGVAPKVYAWFDNALPKLLTSASLASQESELPTAEKSSLVFAIEAGETGLTINSSTGEITASAAAAGTATVTVKAVTNGSTAIPNMDAAMVITLT